jgi:hypothetical protein
MAFYNLRAGEAQFTQHRILKQFSMPFMPTCDLMQGCAVSIEAGANLVGHSAGWVRNPFSLSFF